jgi:hypothetical protein
VIGGSSTFLQISDFAHAVSMGPVNESTQSIIQYLTNIDDPSNILNNLSLNQQGILNIDFSLNYGVATIEVTLQDDGGTAFGGDDTSLVQSFNVIYTDFSLDNELIYKNGFDISCGEVAFLNSQFTN